MKFFVIFLGVIGFSLVFGPLIVYGQYLGDKLPPNTMIIDETGEYVFPPSYVDFYYSDPRFEKYSISAEHYGYDIPYMISNGIILKMSIDCSNVELVLDVDPSGKQGWITLALPRQLIDSKMSGHKDDVFIVLRDSQEIQRTDIASEKIRLLLIPFTDNTLQINIIGVNYPVHAGKNACDGNNEPPFSFLLSPLKQSKSGIPNFEIRCKENLVLTFKHNSQPICVTQQTNLKLLERGWARDSETFLSKADDWR